MVANGTSRRNDWKNRYQAVGDNGEGRKIVHLLSEVNISSVEDGRPKPKSIFILFSIFYMVLEQQISYIIIMIKKKFSWQINHHALSETTPYNIQTEYMGAVRGTSLLRRAIHLTCAPRLRSEKSIEAGSWIPRIRTKGHLPWNCGVLLPN